MLELAFAHLVAGLLDLAARRDATADYPSPPSPGAQQPGTDADDGEGPRARRDAHHGGSAAPVDARPSARAARLASLDLAGSSDDVLVDAVRAWQQVASWAAAQQAAVVGELLARGGASSAAAEAVVHELTAALVTSRRAATALVGRAVGLAASPRVAEALADGRIDVARADVLVTSESVPAPVRERVAVELVGTAERMAAAAERRHVWIDPAPDQMAWLTALLPADDAAHLWSRLDATSREVVRASGETRTLGQVRADTLTDLVTGDAAPPGRGSRGFGAVTTVVNVTVPATALLGLDESTAELGGYGPVPAAVARVLASDGDATWRRILTDPATGAVTDVSRTAYRPGAVLGELVRTRDTTCTFPGCRVPAARCDLDHVDPFEAARPTVGQTRADNLHPVCRAHHNAKTHGGWRTRRDVDGAITWTAPSGHGYTVPARSLDPAGRGEPPVRHQRPRPASMAAPGTPPSVRPQAARPATDLRPDPGPVTARTRATTPPTDSRPEHERAVRYDVADDGDPPF